MEGEYVRGLAGCPEFSVDCHVIREGEPQAVRLAELQVDVDSFAVTAGFDKLRFDGKEGAVIAFVFETGERDSVDSENFCPRLLEPDGVNGMVNDGHRVCFGVTDFDVGGVFNGACFGVRIHAENIQQFIHIEFRFVRDLSPKNCCFRA